MLAPVLAVGGCTAYVVHSVLTWGDMSLGEAAKAFHLTIPRGASDVKYQAFSDFQGKASLTLRFTTTASGLRSFLASDGLPAPTRHPSRDDVTGIDIGFTDSGCGSPPGPGAPHVAYAQYPGGDPAMLIDLADPAHPVVWFRAADI